jgi:chromosome segregation ATPase/CheY-like chemotaxis protein
MSQGQADSPKVHDFLSGHDPSPEELVLLRSALDGLRTERDSLIRRLQAAESSAREKTQLVEARWREAASQVDALKRSAQTARGRLEGDLAAVSKRAAQAEATAAHWQQIAQELHGKNAELLTAVDAAQCRLADLETESAIYSAELQRIESELAVSRQQLAEAQAKLDQTESALQQQQDATRSATARNEELQRELENTRARMAQELEDWGATAAQREAELLGLRDDLARRLEEQESRAIELQQQLDQAQAQLCQSEARSHDLASEIARLGEELSAARADVERERSVYEKAARDREAVFQQQWEEQQHRLAEETARRDARIEALAAEIRSQQEDADATVRRLTGEIAHLRAELEARQVDLSETAQRREQLAQELEQLRGAFGELEGRLQQVDAERSQDAAALVAARAECSNLQAQLQEALAACGRAELAQRQAEDQAITLKQQREELEVQSVAILQTQEALAQRVAEGETQLAALEADRARLCAELEVAHRQREEINALLSQARTELAEVQEDHAAVRASGQDAERERTELRLQIENLSKVIRQLGHEREEQRAAAVLAQQSLTSRIEDLTAERDAQLLRLAELEALSRQLERECDRLKRERTNPDELRRYKSEVSRLEEKIEEIERQRGEAAQNHSAAVAGYMVELNQRSESLHAREIELQRAGEELGLLRQSCEEAMVQLESERRERAELEKQLAELRKAAATGVSRPATEAPLRLQTSPAPAPKTAAASPAAPKVGVAKSPVATAGRSPQTGPAGGARLAHLKEEQPLVVVHLEEGRELRESVHRVVSRIPGVHYGNTTEILDRHKGAATLLAVNFLNRAHDPVAAIRTRVIESPVHQDVFAYCADGNFGFSFGEANFFEHPIDADACVSWLMETCGAVQRLLVASGDIEMTSQLRSALSRIRCSASVGLDLRQVTDLMPMIQPEALLIDLSLPRAEGLRLISRLRADTKTRDLPIGVILPSKQKLAELRQHAARAARESPMPPDLLAAALAGQLGLEDQAPAQPDLGVAEAG